MTYKVFGGTLSLTQSINQSVIFQVQTAENSAATESVQRQLSETADKLHRTEQLLADTQKVDSPKCVCNYRPTHCSRCMSFLALNA